MTIIINNGQMSLFKRSVIVLVEATKNDSEMSATLYYECYFWQSYKKKLYKDIMKDVYKGYKFNKIKVI